MRTTVQDKETILFRLRAMQGEQLPESSLILIESAIQIVELMLDGKKDKPNSILHLVASNMELLKRELSINDWHMLEDTFTGIASMLFLDITDYEEMAYNKSQEDYAIVALYSDNWYCPTCYMARQEDRGNAYKRHIAHGKLAIDFPGIQDTVIEDISIQYETSMDIEEIRCAECDEHLYGNDSDDF